MGYHRAGMRLPKGLLRRLVAGGLFAALSIQLIYDLNPQIEISVLRLLVVTILYGLYGAVVFGLTLWLIRLARRKLIPPEEPRPHGFGFIVLASTYCALVFWFHRHAFEFYLPLEAVRNLSRAGPILGILTLLLFALWIVERTAIGWRRQFLFVSGLILVGIAISVLSFQRGSLSIQRPPESALPSVEPETRFALVTISRLPHDWIVTMDAEGVAPFFTGTREEAFFARLQPFPTRSIDSIWASLLSGKLPYRHGVAGRYEWQVPWERSPFLILPNGLGMEAWGLPAASRSEIGRASGDARQIWEILAAGGMEARVVSSYGAPASATSSQTLETSLFRRFEGYGETGREALRHLAADLGLVRALSDAVEAQFLHLDGLGRIQDLLDSTNELPGAEGEAGSIYRDYVGVIGDALAEFRKRNPDVLLIIASPTAVRPNFAPRDPIGLLRSRLSEESGEADGFLAATGPGVASTPPSLVIAEPPDLVPTVLYGLGYPVGRDMDGGVLLEMFEQSVTEERPLELIPSWESVRGPLGPE